MNDKDYGRNKRFVKVEIEVIKKVSLWFELATGN